MKTGLFYHSNDFDGICSGFIMKNHFGLDLGDCHDIDFKWFWSIVEKYDRIIMVDFSLPGTDMKTLSEKVKLLWIDHHKSSVEIEKKFKLEDVDGVRSDIGLAACQLTWQYLKVMDDGYINKIYNTSNEFFNDIPVFINLIGFYDTLQFDVMKDILEFQYGLRGIDSGIDSNIWKVLLDESTYLATFQSMIKNIIIAGESILKYVNNDNIKQAKRAFEIEFEGLTFIALNRLGTNSKIFDSVFDPNKHDAMMLFGKTEKLWFVHMYCPNESKLDLSEIAVKHNGDGYQKACGFTCSKLPFKISKNKKNLN